MTALLSRQRRAEGRPSVNGKRGLRILQVNGLTVLGIRTDQADFFIYNVAYNLKALKVRARRAGGGPRYLINPAFGPALGINETMDIHLDLSEPSLFPDRLSG